MKSTSADRIFLSRAFCSSSHVYVKAIVVPQLTHLDVTKDYHVFVKPTLRCTARTHTPSAGKFTAITLRCHCFCVSNISVISYSKNFIVRRLLNIMIWQQLYDVFIINREWNNTVVDIHKILLLKWNQDKKNWGAIVKSWESTQNFVFHTVH